MSKAIKCSDVGLDCSFVAQGKDEQEVLSKVTEHANKDHGMTEISQDVLEKIRAAIRDN